LNIPVETGWHPVSNILEKLRHILVIQLIFQRYLYRIRTDILRPTACDVHKLRQLGEAQYGQCSSNQDYWFEKFRKSFVFIDILESCYAHTAVKFIGQNMGS
jgi:hypothetical protein